MLGRGALFAMKIKYTVPPFPHFILPCNNVRNFDFSSLERFEPNVLLLVCSEYRKGPLEASPGNPHASPFA